MNTPRMNAPKKESFRDHPRQSTGFTAIELMVTLTIIIVIAAIAIPQWQEVMLKSRLQTTANLIFHSLTQARATAVMRHAPVTMCTGNPTDGCQTNAQSDWTSGLIAFTDRDQDGALDADERVVFTQPATSGLIITGNSPMKKPIIFLPLGFAEQPGGAFSAGRVRVCAPKDFPGHAQDVVLLKSGMARVESAQFGGQCPAP